MTRYRSAARLLLLAGVLSATLAAGCKSVLVITETSLGPLPAGVAPESVVISPDARHVFWKVSRGTKTVVVANGAEGKEYDKVFSFPPVFSPDGRRWGYTAQRGEKRYLVLDGQECAPACDRIGGKGPVFSPDSRRVACYIWLGDHSYVLVDGVVGPPFDPKGMGDLFFSPDSRHVAYWGIVDGKTRVVRDQRMFDGVYDYLGSTGFGFSPDSRRLVWIGFRGGKQFAVVDGAEGPPFDALASESGIQFSADSRHWAYGARNGEKWKAVIDGVEGPWYDGLDSTGVAFGPDGRTAYKADRQGKDLIVTGGREVPLGGVLQKPGCFFDRAGRLHYAIRVRNQKRVVVDGKEGELFDHFSQDSPRISPDGSRVAWKIIRGQEWFLLIDGAQIGPCVNIAEGDPFFSSDSQRYAYQVFLPHGRCQMVLDGKPLREPGAQAFGQFSPDGRHFAFGEWHGEKACVILDGAPGKEYDGGVRCLLFGPDSRHLAYGAHSGDRNLLVVDGLESPGYDDIPKDVSISFPSPTSVHAVFIKNGAFVLVRAELRLTCL